MIKVKFITQSHDDICDIVENILNSKIDVADWIAAHIPGISFDCMNYPYGTENCYECYFQSENDSDAAQNIYKVLKRYFAEVNDINVEIWTVDSKLDDINNVVKF
ncbi:hypothetical protein [Lacrimispora sp.]|jgi:hypothetical protein|uniref:hypothetical protein n=2 Tax=Lacrimispora sp. TaxID=2719234 RepID=UPI00289A6D75|nr:hypothetical protein [Lacrimispora sp.]